MKRFILYLKQGRENKMMGWGGWGCWGCYLKNKKFSMAEKIIIYCYVCFL